MSDTQAVEGFLSRAIHPSLSASSEALAAHINRELDDHRREDLLPSDEAWRRRLGALSLDIDAFDTDQLSALLEQDTTLATMYAWLRQMALEKRSDLAEERTAVLALRGLRAATSAETGRLHEFKDRTEWQIILERLQVV